MLADMRVAAPLLVAVVAFGTARFARSCVERRAESDGLDAPFAPSPRAAPFVAVGYRELAADLLYVRMLSYFNGDDSSGPVVADLTDAIIELDPKFQRAYDRGANAMTLAHRNVNQPVFLRAIHVLERGMAEFPNDWTFPYVAAQIYAQDLQTTDPAQRRAWDERGVLLMESASRKPNAPASSASWAAMLRTKLGEQERAVASIQEALLITDNPATRKRLLETLEQIEAKNADQLIVEVFEQRRKFEHEWKKNRPLMRPTMYLLIGSRLHLDFDMGDLATGGRDLFVEEEERLEPVE